MFRRKDNGLWVEVIREYDGKRVSPPKYIYGRTQAEVKKKINEYRGKQENKKCFGPIAEEWSEQHFPTLYPSTVRGYTASFNRAIERFGDMPISDITPQQINELLHNLINEGFGKKVIATQRNVVNMILNYAVMKSLISYNPCTAIKLPRGLRSEHRHLPEPADIEAVENSDWLFPFFILYTGCRRGEALAIQYEDIDRKNRIININKSVGYDGNRPFLKVPKTEAGIRTIGLIDRLAERLPKGRGLIFPSPSGGFYTNGEIKYEWLKWQKENNTNVTAHQLRHYYATLLFDAGLTTKEAQYLLGHSTVAMTQDTYTHIRKERLRMSTEKLNSYVQNVYQPSETPL